MTFYEDDDIEIVYVEKAKYWVLFLNCKPMRDARRENTLEAFVKRNSVPWNRPASI